jgi:hypothetical protein
MQPVPERVATLEERVKNIAEEVQCIAVRVDEIYQLIQRGKGAKWAVLTIVSAISGGFGVIAHKLLPF